MKYLRTGIPSAARGRNVMHRPPRIEPAPPTRAYYGQAKCFRIDQSTRLRVTSRPAPQLLALRLGAVARAQASRTVSPFAGKKFPLLRLRRVESSLSATITTGTSPIASNSDCKPSSSHFILTNTISKLS
jgi:hypothetical protein